MTNGAKQNCGVGSATAKTIVCGEHFVLDGAAALAIALPGLRTRVSLERSRTTEITSDQQLSQEQLFSTQLMVSAALRATGVDAEVLVSIHSDIPIGRGLGSSAALAVACCRAAAALTGEAVAKAALLSRCMAVEDVVHGQSSGLDPATAMSDGGVVFRSGQIVQSVSIALRGALADARWILADVGTAPATSQAIAQANRAKAGLGTERMRSLIKTVDSASWLAARALKEDSVSDLSEAMRRCGEALRAIGVVDERMQHACRTGLDAGALAMKQTGAGLGGTMLALAPNRRIAETVADHLAPIAQSVRILTVAADDGARDGELP